MVDGNGLENRRGSNVTASSNLALSARLSIRVNSRNLLKSISADVKRQSVEEYPSG